MINFGCCVTHRAWAYVCVSVCMCQHVFAVVGFLKPWVELQVFMGVGGTVKFCILLKSLDMMDLNTCSYAFTKTSTLMYYYPIWNHKQDL